MGNSRSCGFGVLNDSNFSEINVGLSMGFTHYYENEVKKGKIFYRWPGAVFYTVYAYARDENGVNDIGRGTMAITKGFSYCERKHCYGGGSGTWLVVEGGPKTNEEGITSNQLQIKVTTQDDVFRRGSFTRYSHSKFHTVQGLSCTNNCNICRQLAQELASSTV